MREIDRVLEIALYVEDMGRAVEFYRRVFRFAVLAKSTEPDRLTALDVGKTQVLLLSKKGASVEAVATPGGKIPPCDGGGNSHLAFPIETNELKDWEDWLAENDVVIESTVRWDRGGQSLYFRDPDGNCWNWPLLVSGRPINTVA
jgi:catechol 2,3-dioxygenase-like lactoylglutathione lyase family enzyme